MNFFDWIASPRIFWKCLACAITITVVITIGLKSFDNNRDQIAINEIVSQPAKKPIGAVIETDMGQIEFAFDNPDSVGVSVFTLLAQKGIYNGTRVHRIVENFLMESGDPYSRDLNNKEYWGEGEIQFTFPDEIDPNLKMVRGVVAFSNRGPNTNNSSFFILVADAPFLDNDYTVLGKVVSGMDIVDKITKQKVGLTGMPAREIKIQQINIFNQVI